MNVLGISAFYHDSAAAILRDGELIAAAQEERFTRKKHDPSFPANAVRFCLDEAGLELEQLDAIAFYDKPMLKFERLLETYYHFVPQGWRSFITAIPVWINEKLFFKDLLRKELAKIGSYDRNQVKLLFPEHHLSHAASAFYPSPFEEAAILTVDGVGEWATSTISMGRGREVTLLKELRFPHSVGLLYSAFTYYLGFRVNSGEYKLMGLAPYGNPNSEQVARFVKIIEDQLVDIRPDGSIRLDQKYFSYATGLRMVPDRKWERLFGFPRRPPEAPIEAIHCDLALAIQQVTEEIVLRMARETKRLTGADYLCLAGGVALNCVANGKLQREGIFKDLYIQPAAGDAGGALGAALAAKHLYFGQERAPRQKQDEMKGSYLGPKFFAPDIERLIRRYGAEYERFDDFSGLTERIATALNEGKVVGWFQGHMEFGPRALGNRSILGDPRNPEMQKRLNLKIKYRESFRPFAPAVLAEEADRYFELPGDSPYMLLVQPVKESSRRPLPEGYHELPLREKLYTLRSDIPAVTHIDFSARIQTVHRETNPEFHALLSAFKAKTGCGMLVNTSFNVRGEPIVCTPQDAFECFLRTEMDYLVMDHYVFDKTKQEGLAAPEREVGDFPLD
ncbi:MAG: carbamoyltransferase [Saprospiraceae bacterium]|nr:carbamoyltransferase [Saprospiraceae bacterium]MCB0625343.1 carbamoyltransferase [Saprospiraceae bacterium]